MQDFVHLAKFDDRDQAYFTYVDAQRAVGGSVMSLDRFEDWWRGLKGLPRKEARAYRPVGEALKASVKLIQETPTHKERDAVMATTTASRRGRLTSPYLHNDPDVAYAAYLKMPHLKVAGAKKLSKAQFKKSFDKKHQEAIAKQNNTNQATTQVVGGSDVDWTQFDPNVIEQLRAAGMNVPEPVIEDEPEDDNSEAIAKVVQALVASGQADLIPSVLASMGTISSTSGTQASSPGKSYRQRTSRDDVPENAARNAVLWALNSEGLLFEAYERAEKNGDVLDDGTPYITQECGTEVLSEVFGPLPDRNAA